RNRVETDAASATVAAPPTRTKTGHTGIAPAADATTTSAARVSDRVAVSAAYAPPAVQSRSGRSIAREQRVILTASPIFAGVNAVDACVAAGFAGWVAESPLTGPGAGGFALVAPADGSPPRLADFFVATPGLGRPSVEGAEMHAVDVGFGGDSQTTQVFRIGEASCAVPGAAAGLEAVHRAYGRLPWPILLEPAIELARGGVEISREQAHLHAILDLILRH